MTVRLRLKFRRSKRNKRQQLRLGRSGQTPSGWNCCCTGWLLLRQAAAAADHYPNIHAAAARAPLLPSYATHHAHAHHNHHQAYHLNPRRSANNRNVVVASMEDHNAAAGVGLEYNDGTVNNEAAAQQQQQAMFFGYFFEFALSGSKRARLVRFVS